MTSTRTSSLPPLASVVTVTYQQLLDFAKDETQDKKKSAILLDCIGQAFGNSPDCLGLIAVEGVPDFESMRLDLLMLGPQLVKLACLEQDCVHPESLYSVGWSHGKEQVAMDQPDLAKGSFYANPLTDDLVATLSTRDPSKAWYWQEQKRLFPACYASNVWPTSDPPLPQFKKAFCNLGKRMAETGVLLAAVCDEYCRQRHGIENLGLQTMLRESMNAKGRFLHYFPMEQQQQQQQQQQQEKEESRPLLTWCGWHNDHGSLTALAPGLYLDEQGQPVEQPDPAAGLYIQARSGQIYRVALPSAVCAFQIGETSQIQSGGALQATPHAVFPPSLTHSHTRHCSREAFAVFLEPEFEMPLHLPPGIMCLALDNWPTVTDAQGSSLPKSVLPLHQRWKPGFTFGDFHNATVSGFTKY